MSHHQAAVAACGRDTLGGCAVDAVSAGRGSSPRRPRGRRSGCAARLVARSVIGSSRALDGVASSTRHVPTSAPARRTPGTGGRRADVTRHPRRPSACFPRRKSARSWQGRWRCHAPASSAISAALPGVSRRVLAERLRPSRMSLRPQVLEVSRDSGANLARPSRMTLDPAPDRVLLVRRGRARHRHAHRRDRRAR